MMSFFKISWGLIMGLTVSFSFNASAQESGNSAEESEAITPYAYLEMAVEELKSTHIRRAEVDWPALEAEVYAMIEDAENYEDTYPAILRAIDIIGERHTFFITAERVRALNGEVKEKEEGTSARPLPGSNRIAGHYISEEKVGYLNVPSFSFGDDEQFAIEGQQTIQTVSNSGMVCGWVVDFRENGGGNMWPMVTGLGPLLEGHSPLGFFDSGDSFKLGWFYENGIASLETQEGLLPLVDISEHAAKIDQTDRPVAVLMGERQGSSGEFTAMAVMAIPGSRSFGSPTAGYTTANKPLIMPDEAELLITTSIGVEKDGAIHTGGPMQPDILVEDSNPDDGRDEVLEAAAEWIEDQNACE